MVMEKKRLMMQLVLEHFHE
uniref:Uncharacterized protein n=1 Tax=Arundo donax TaxID=35708 RepID=A0A0A9A360_ARUDO